MVVDVETCPRCGVKHRGLFFKKLQQASSPVAGPIQPYTHWSTCPKTHEPMLYAVLLEALPREPRFSQVT